MSPCFTWQNGQSAVTKQPEDEDELFGALQVCCACALSERELNEKVMQHFRQFEAV